MNRMTMKEKIRKCIMPLALAASLYFGSNSYAQELKVEAEQPGRETITGSVPLDIAVGAGTTAAVVTGIAYPIYRINKKKRLEEAREEIQRQRIRQGLEEPVGFTDESQYDSGIMQGFVAIDNSDRSKAIAQTRTYLDELVESFPDFYERRSFPDRGEHFTNLYLGNTRYHMDRECSYRNRENTSIRSLSAGDRAESIITMSLLKACSEIDGLELYGYRWDVFEENYIPNNKLGKLAEALVDCSMIMQSDEYREELQASKYYQDYWKVDNYSDGDCQGKRKLALEGLENEAKSVLTKFRRKMNS